MGRSREAWLYAALVSLTLSVSARGAFAEDAKSNAASFRVIVDETDWCTGETFARQILRRAPSTRIAATNEPALSIEARLSAEPGIVRGHLTLQETNGFVTERDVTGESCAEVTAALALIAAVFLDPNATAV